MSITLYRSALSPQNVVHCAISSLQTSDEDDTIVPKHVDWIKIWNIQFGTTTYSVTKYQLLK